MAKNRMVNTHFWRDSWINTLSPPEKLLYLHLLTNPETNVIGCYEIRTAQISLDTGIEETSVERVLQKFQAAGRVTYMEGWLIIHNFQKHQSLRGELMEKAKKTITNMLPDRLYKAYTSPIHTVSADTSISNSNSNSNSKREGTEEIKIISLYYRSHINKRATLTRGSADKIKARLKSYDQGKLKKAMDNFSKDKWQMSHNAHRGMAWFFHSDDRIEQYINLKPREGIVSI